MAAKYDALMTRSQPRRRYLAVAEEGVARDTRHPVIFRPGDRLPDRAGLFASNARLTRATCFREIFLLRPLELGASSMCVPGAWCPFREERPNSRPCALGLSFPVRLGATCRCSRCGAYSNRRPANGLCAYEPVRRPSVIISKNVLDEAQAQSWLRRRRET